MKLQNKVAIVTGASSGIGAATAIKFAAEGAKVVINYHSNRAGAEEVYNKIKKLGGQAIFVQADITREADAKKLIDAALSEYSDLDILVNNAGKYVDNDEWNGEFIAWQETLNLNLITALNCSKHACNYFINAKKGILINLASRFGVIGDEYGIAYGAAKAGIINITKAYAKVLAPYGRANAVSPGATKAGYWATAPESEVEAVKEKILLKSLNEIGDIANAILFLACDDSRMITGQNIIVDGGYTLK